MPIIHVIKENTTKRQAVLHSTVPTTADVSLSETTPEGQTESLNQSALLSNLDIGTEDSPFPTAAVVVPLLVVLGICTVLLLGYKFQKKIKDWMCRRFGEPRADIELTTMAEHSPETAGRTGSSSHPDSKDSEANTSFTPLLEETQNSDAHLSP